MTHTGASLPLTGPRDGRLLSTHCRHSLVTWRMTAFVLTRRSLERRGMARVDGRSHRWELDERPESTPAGHTTASRLILQPDAHWHRSRTLRANSPAQLKSIISRKRTSGRRVHSTIKGGNRPFPPRPPMIASRKLRSSAAWSKRRNSGLVYGPARPLPGSTFGCDLCPSGRLQARAR